MAELKGLNATKRNAEPSQKIAVEQYNGRVRRAYDEITLSAELALNDTIDLMELPQGATIVDARMVIPVDAGGVPAGQLDLGWTDNGSDAADQDGLFAGASEADFGAGAIDAKMLGTAAGYGKKFSAATLIQGKCVEASAGSSGNKIQVEVFFVVD